MISGEAFAGGRLPVQLQVNNPHGNLSLLYVGAVPQVDARWIDADGDTVKIATGVSPARFLLVSARPLHEPIARYGPFVMNTREEIEQALADLRHGTFV